jgi:hypothetical protein
MGGLLKKKKYKQMPLFPELEQQKKVKQKELTYTDLSKLAVKRKKQLLLKQIEKANTLEEIEAIELKIAELDNSPKTPSHKKSQNIKNLLIEVENEKDN